MFVGPDDLMTDADLAGDVEAVVSELRTRVRAGLMTVAFVAMTVAVTQA